MSKQRRVVERQTPFGKPWYEVQVKGLFGWHNEFPGFDCFPAETFDSKEEAIDMMNRLNRGSSEKVVELERTLADRPGNG